MNVDPLDAIAGDVIRQMETKSRRTFAGVDARDLEAEAAKPTDWIVDYVLSIDQPTVFGAASKVGKTTQLIDLAVSLATKTDWLGHFNVPKRRRTLLITGESNKKAAGKRIAKALKAKSLSWDDLGDNLRVEAVEFPTLPSINDQETVRQLVEEYKIDIVIVDPLYRGLGGIDSHRMPEVASAIVSFFKACQPAGLILSHHITKAAARLGGPPSMEDLSGAGLAESCGNWWLMGRNVPYAFDQIHDLAVTFGGRDEQSGIKRIVFDESKWTFEITSGADIQEQKQRERDQKKQEAEEEKLRYASAQVIHVLANQKQFQPRSWIETRSKAGQGMTRKAIADLLDSGQLIEGDYLDKCNRTKTGIGIPK